MAKKLQTYEKSILKKLSSETNIAIEIGKLLLEARDDHFMKPNGKPKGKEFVEWAEEAFGFKKVSTYQYLNVGTVFGTEEMQEQFKDVAARVLFGLMKDADMLAAASKAVEDGEKIDTNWIEEYKKANKPPKEESDETEEEEEGKGGKGSGSEGSESGGMDDAYIVELEQKIEKLEQEANKQSSVDMTAHFQGVADFLLTKKPHEVLYLEEGVTDKRKVNKAKRDILKLYDEALTGEAGEPVREVINTAADAILGIPAEEAEEPKKEKKAKKKAKK